MPLYLIGLGLYDEKDITIRGLDYIKCADHVYLESYTSILLTRKENLESFYGKSIKVSDRRDVEERCDEMLELAQTSKVAFLVVGDPFSATTHMDLVLRAIEKNIEIQTVHNASIMNSVAACGLYLYTFGETVSIPFFLDTWRPDSFYSKLKKNRKMGLHTLCLLDIKVKEQSIENLMKGKEIFEPPRYMTINQAIEQLLEIEDEKIENVCSRQTKAFGIARLGSPDSEIRSGTFEELLEYDFGTPLHSLVICGPTLQCIEEKFFELRRCNK